MTSVPAHGVLPVAIAGIGAHVPSRVITNDDLATILDTSDEWIRTRTGIAERHAAADSEAVSDLAIAAAKEALTDAGLGVEDVAAVVLATTSGDHIIPGTAPAVAARLGTEVAAFDVNAACSGFIYGLRVASGLVATGTSPVLLIGAEALTRYIDWGDRSTAVLFGDGAGAAVLVHDAAGALGPFVLGADGTDVTNLYMRAGGSRYPIRPGTDDSYTAGIRMNGPQTYRRAVAHMVAASTAVLDRAGIGVADVDLFVGHQANQRILDAVAHRLGLAPERMHVTIGQHGNTSAASIPLALTDARAAGRVRHGDRLLLTAFGAGYTWGATLLTWTGTGGDRT